MRDGRIGVCALALAVALAACGGSDAGAPRTPTPTEAPASTAPPTGSPARDALARQYERLRDAHRAIGPVWESLAAGGQVRCGAPIQALSPAAISAEGDPALASAAGHLRDAAVALDGAARLWQAECANPRPQPPADVINRGRLAVRDAGAALDVAARELGIE